MKIAEKYPVIVMFLGVMGASMSSAFVRMSQAPSAVTAFYRLFWTVLLMSPVVLGKREIRQELLRVDRKSLCLSALSGIMLAVFSTIMGHSIFSWCLKYLPPTFVSAAKLCEPVIASVFAAILFREIPGLTQIIGAVIILIGVVSYSILEIKGE